MGICTNEVKTIVGVIKGLIRIFQYALPIILLVNCTIDAFKIIISNKEEDSKKQRKVIFNRIFNCLLLLLIPTLIFILFNFMFDDTMGVSEVQKCWSEAEIEFYE